MQTRSIFITGATGMTGSRMAARLAKRGYAVRRDSRRVTPRFDWTDPSSWNDCLDGNAAVYIGRAPRDFSNFAREVAATGLWRNVA